jgi:hypothetical protein
MTAPNLPIEITIDELLKRPSTLPDIDIAMTGFSSEADAREVGGLVLDFLKVFGKSFNLERLEAVSLAYDYADALAKVDTGGFLRPPSHTQNKGAVGIAMTVNVLRDEVPKAHIVLHAGYLSLLRNPDDPNFQIAVYTLAHEASHVHDLARQDQAYPGVYGRQIFDTREAVLFDIAQSCWEEYIACLLSAAWASPSQTGYYESTFCAVVTGIRERGNAYIMRYRIHADVGRLIREVVSEYGAALKYWAYLLGHIEGLGHTLQNAAPTANTSLQSLKLLSPLFDKFGVNLRAMYEIYGEWPGLGVYDRLKDTVHEVLKVAGIEFQSRPGGAYYLNVPFTPETMP